MVTIKFLSESPTFKENLNQVLSVFLLMTASRALANEGLFEPTQRPLLTRAASLSFAETIEEPHCSQVKKAKTRQNLDKILAFSPDYSLDSW